MILKPSNEIFVLDSLLNGKPVKRVKQRSDVGRFGVGVEK